jgi:hypothetical protein
MKARIFGDLGGKALSFGSKPAQTGQNSPVLFTDRLTGGIPILLIRSDLQASAG